MSGIEKVYQFLDEVHTYYLATVEGDQPRVRAFGTALLHGGKLYIQTGKVKPVSKQIAANPKVEICAFKGGKRSVQKSAQKMLDDTYADVYSALDDLGKLGFDVTALRQFSDVLQNRVQ